MRNVVRGLLIALTLGFGIAQIETIANAKASTEKVSQVKEVASAQANIKNNFINKVLAENPTISAANIEKVDFNVGAEPENEEEAGEARKTFRATAYCLKGTTASGSRVRRGIVAADPRILRLGTRIHMNAGRYTGHYLVADTGGAIKGHILDIWVPTCSEAVSWGRKNVFVKVVNNGRK